jgi:hypothetical protein
MAKGQTTISDFAVAPRRARNNHVTETLTPERETSDPDQAKQTSAPSLIAPDSQTRKRRATARVLEQEESRLRLSDLKRARARESKHYVNCPLDYDTKKRLERAASENDLKMTVIIKAAIDQYLRDNGY